MISLINESDIKAISELYEGVRRISVVYIFAFENT